MSLNLVLLKSFVLEYSILVFSFTKKERKKFDFLVKKLEKLLLPPNSVFL